MPNFAKTLKDAPVQPEPVTPAPYLLVDDHSAAAAELLALFARQGYTTDVVLSEQTLDEMDADAIVELLHDVTPDGVPARGIGLPLTAEAIAFKRLRRRGRAVLFSNWHKEVPEDGQLLTPFANMTQKEVANLAALVAATDALATVLADTPDTPDIDTPTPSDPTA